MKKSDDKLNAFVFLPWIVLGCVCFVDTSALHAQEETVSQVLARMAQNPTIHEVQQAVLEQARLEPYRFKRLMSRIRWAGILPPCFYRFC